MKNAVQEIWLQKSSNHFRKERGLQLDLDELVEFREGGDPSPDKEGGRGGMGLVYLRHREKPGLNVLEGVCPGIGRNQKKGICRSYRESGPKCPVQSGAPALLRFQPLSQFRGPAQDRVGLSWAAVAPLSCKFHPSLHSRKGVELWNALSHLSLVLAEPGVRLLNAHKPQTATRDLGGVECCELLGGGVVRGGGHGAL